MTLQIKSPVVVGVQGPVKLIASQTDLNKKELNGPAQTYSPTLGYSRVQPLQVWYKWGTWDNPKTDEDRAIPTEKTE
jgi:hypothetical protein